MFVYVIVNHTTLKIYVGQHKGTNLRQYLQQKMSEAQHRISARSLLYASMRKHPNPANWSIHPLAFGLQTRAEVDYWETFYIKLFHTQDPDYGYNICRGGEGFTGPQSESAKEKIVAALIGRLVSEETRAKIGASQPRSSEQLVALDQRGRKRSEETKEKIRQHNATGVCGMLGRKHSEETLAKMRAAAAGRKLAPETKAKLSAAHKKPWSEKRRAAYKSRLFVS